MKISASHLLELFNQRREEGFEESSAFALACQDYEALVIANDPSLLRGLQILKMYAAKYEAKTNLTAQTSETV